MKGLTLLEILVAIGIFGFVLAGIFGVWGSGGSHYTANLVSLDLQRQARQGMSWLTKEIRQASWETIEIIPPDPDSATPYDPDDLNSNNNYSINFKVRLTPDTLSDFIHYSVAKTLVAGPQTLSQLMRTSPYPGTAKERANNIRETPLLRGLVFSKDNSKQILHITVRASKTFLSSGQEQTPEFFLTEQVQVRNP